MEPLYYSYIITHSRKRIVLNSFLSIKLQKQHNLKKVLYISKIVVYYGYVSKERLHEMNQPTKLNVQYIPTNVKIEVLDLNVLRIKG